MIRVITLSLALLGLAWPAGARCVGSDLIAALPGADRAALIAAADAQPFAHGNLWRAERDGAVIHVVGTYHLADPRHDSVLERLEPLLDSASVLLVEAGPEEENRLKEELIRRPGFMILTEGPRLPDLLGDDDWSQVAAEMAARGIPAFIASGFRPWYTAMMLGIPACAMDSIKAGERGLDHRLIEAAAARGLPVRALEPFDTLFAIFGALTLEQEMDMIRTALRMAANPEDMTATLANAYFSGRARLIWEFTMADALAHAGAEAEAIRAEFALMEDVAMVRRNRAWIPVLIEAASGGEVLAAAGALHLPGRQGVLALLEGEGFTLTRLDGDQ